jgi:hypothetical protein
VPAQLHEREDRLRVDRHLRLGTRDPVPLEQLVVVGDDPVVDPDDRAVPDRVVVRGDVRMALREVSDVDEGLAGLGRNRELVEEPARTAPKLRHARAAARAAVGVADGIRTALGDSGEERLSGERPVDGRLRIEAESGYAAHVVVMVSGSDFTLAPTRFLSPCRTARRE